MSSSLADPVAALDNSSELSLPSDPLVYHEEARTATAPGRHRGRYYWVLATLVLCSYGFFKEFKPSEPFLTLYLTSDIKNFTKDEVNSKIYPYFPYSYLVSAFFVFLLTDLVRYKPVILVESLAYLCTRILLLWGTSINSMQWMQVAYGVATATEIAYFSYIYAAVPVLHYKKVTSYVRAIRLFGQSMAGILGQVLISTEVASYFTLNIISFVSVSFACVFALLLPDVYNCTCCSVMCPVNQHSCKDNAMRPVNKNSCTNCKTVTTNLQAWSATEIKDRARDFFKSYRHLKFLRWSIWWSLAMCGVLQVGNYVQSLWKEVASSSGDHHEYNGVVEAMATLCAAGAAFILSVLKVNWSLWGEVTIGILSLVDSGMLFLASSASHIWLAYICHIVYRTTYTFLITIASAQLALEIGHQSFALIFGFNTFLALILQTVLTLVVADEHGLNLPIRTQFIVYSGYYFALTLVFISAGIYKLTNMGWRNSVHSCWLDTTPHPPVNLGNDHPVEAEVVKPNSDTHILQGAKKRNVYN